MTVSMHTQATYGLTDIWSSLSVLRMFAASIIVQYICGYVHLTLASQELLIQLLKQLPSHSIEWRAGTVCFLVFLKKRQLVLNVSEPSTEWTGML